MPRLAILLLVLAAPAWAAPPTLPPPTWQPQRFAADRLAALAPLLGNGEIAAVEVDPAGRPRQILIVGYTPAPPEVVHQVVAQAERYPEFLFHFSKSEILRRPDGALLNRWTMKLPIGSFYGVFEIRTDPSSPGRLVRIDSLDRRSAAIWEFLPAPGGGTVALEYVHYEPPRSNAVFNKILERDPSNASGINLAAGLMLLKGVLAEAAKRAQGAKLKVQPPPPSEAVSPLDFLLDRATVAVIRSEGRGGLRDVSIVRRIAAPHDRVLGLVSAPEHWPEFMPLCTAAQGAGSRDGRRRYHLTLDGIFADVETDYEMSFHPGGADSLGLDGDLVGSRLRWDLRRDGAATTVIFRVNFRVTASSLILRALVGYEPLFEHGINAGAGVAMVSAIARQAVAPIAPPPGPAPLPSPPPLPRAAPTPVRPAAP